MTANASAREVFEREFPQLRAKVLEAAAALDRITRAPGSPDGDPRVQQVRQALEILRSDKPNRAERIQLVFSLDYDPGWREKGQ